ncbi:hypothetical protein Hdeb2414_s0003g00113891 [Helianthus debilis subsp. tardiflorus]
MACLDHEWEHVQLLQIWKQIQDGNGNSTPILETFTPIEAVSIFTQALSTNELCGILCDKHLFRIVKHWLKADHVPFYNPANDYVILPTLFEIERHHDNKGKEVTSLKEWEIVSGKMREKLWLGRYPLLV